MSTLKTNNIEHLDAATPSIQTTIGGGVVFAGLSTFQGNAQFDGNVNIAGTVTYDDVTNIDSVGLITARIGVSYGAPGAATVIDGNATGIGIGTDGPNSLLEISGTGSNQPVLTFNREPTAPNDAIIGELFFKNNQDSVALIAAKRQSAVDDAYIQFATQSTGGGLAERLRITSAGNVGINSTIPRSKLHVANGNSNFNPGNPTGLGAGAVASLESSGDVALQFLSSTSTDNFIYFGDTDSATTGSIQYDHNVNALSFNVNGGTERLRISSSGDVGISCTPTEKLHISGGDGVKIKLDCPNDYSDSSSIIMSRERGEIKTTIDASGGNPGGSMVLRTRNTAGTMVDAITIGNGQQVSINSQSGTHPFIVSNGGVERVRINSEGRVLINTTVSLDQGNDTAELQVVADVGGGGSQPNSGNALVLGQHTNGVDKAAVAFGLAADNGGESTNACTLDIFTASAGSLTKKMSVNSGGNVDIVDGNLVFETAGHGIDFSATSDGSATVTSEVLDDYEEGNGSPTVSFLTSGTATVAPGGTFKYVKIGDLVTFSFEFNLSAVSNPSGSVKIGLPFASGGGVYSAGAVRLFNVTFTGSPYLEISPSQSYVLVNTSISGSPTGSVNSTGFYFGCVSYRTTS